MWSKRLNVLVAATALLLGCGDSGVVPIDCETQASDECRPPSTTALTGQLGMLSIGGVRYETATTSGVTSSDGAFFYEPGERVRFSLGTTVLGEAEGAQTLSLFHLAGMAEVPVGVEAINDARFESGKLLRVLNLAVMLFTLDEDRNSDNGIVISDETRAAFDGPAADLSLRTRQFRTNVGFRRVLAAVNADAAPGQVRRLANPAVAIATVYAANGVDPEIYALTERRRDQGADGSVDQVFRQMFSPNGFVLSNSRDNDNDTVIDEQGVAEYDENWFPVLETETRLGDPGASILRHSYNEVGDQIGSEYDYDGDSVIDASYTATLNELGEPAELVQTETSGGVATTEIEKLFYNEDGHLVRTEIDRDGDGSIEDVRTITRDSEGRAVRSENDEGDDGVIETIRTTEYDSEGRRTMTSAVYADPAWNDNSIRYTYNDNDETTLVEFDDDGDGSFDRREMRTYGINGLLLNRRVESVPGSVLLSNEQYTYDVRGNLVLRESDSDGDGSNNYVGTSEYSAEGWLLRSTNDFDGDGLLDSENRFTHDANGNLIAEFAYGGDGVLDWISETDYVKTGFGFLFFEVLD